uniref:Uncharacterized protein n=1 Tax=Romanomermis culicivorax TaxID=13658 RepID=A0A915K1N9_ROMCU
MIDTAKTRKHNIWRVGQKSYQSYVAHVLFDFSINFRNVGQVNLIDEHKTHHLRTILENH